MRPRRLREVMRLTMPLVLTTTLLVLITALPGHADPAQGCAVDRLPSILPTPGSAQERLAAEVTAACLKQPPAPQAHFGPVRNRMRARSVTAKSTTLQLGSPLTLDSRTVEIVDAILERPDGCVEFRLGDAELGTVQLQADSLSGKLFGLIPITLDNGLPEAVPLPYIQLTDVTAEGVQLTARTAALHEIIGL